MARVKENSKNVTAHWGNLRTPTVTSKVLLKQIALVCAGLMKENPDFISAVASSDKEKYAFRKTKLYRKLRVDVNISNSRQYERK